MADQRNFRVGYWLGHAALEYGGVGAYALRTISALLRDAESGWQFSLLYPASLQETVKHLTARVPQIVETHLIPTAPIKKSFWQKRIRDSTFKTQSGPFNLTTQRLLETFLQRSSLDLLHFPIPSLPHPHEHVPYFVPPLLNTRIPYIVTVHDVQELRFPEYFSPAQRAIRAAHNWQTLDQARKIIVSYEHVKADLINFFQLLPEKIDICPIPYRAIEWPEPSLPASEIFKEKYDSWKPFLLYPAQTWPHKNHRRLIHALQKVRTQYKTDLKLVCTGHANDYQKEIEALVEGLGLREVILFTGVVPEDELAWLYLSTSLVVIPTEYEAGSFPLLEAMMLGVPVICSNVTSLPDTIGDQRFVFEPDNVEEMSALIFRMLNDSSFRAANIANGERRAAQLRSINAASPFYAAYRSALRL